MINKEVAKRIISDAEKNLSASGALIVYAEKEIEDITKKSQENIKQLSLLL